MARLIPEPLRNRRLLLLMLAVVIPGMVIGILGFVSVSQQRQSRQLKLYEKLNHDLLLFRNELQHHLEKSIGDVYQMLENLRVNYRKPGEIQKVMKDILVKHPLVHYPFIINSRAQFLFPVSKRPSATITQIPLRERLSPRIGEIYAKAEQLEFRERKFIAAIQLYNQCLRKQPEISEKALIMYAVARSYYQLGKFPQALSYLKDINKIENLPALTGKSFYFLFLRQMASVHLRLGQPVNALKKYLILYEEILRYESTTASDEFTFYKNEALDFLNRHMAEGAIEIQRFKRAKAMDKLATASPVDISVRWRFFDLDGPPDEETHITDQNEKNRYVAIRELYLTSDRKLQFYQQLRKSIQWPPQTRSNSIQYRRIKIPADNNQLFIVFKTISDATVSNRSIFFGFHITPSYMEKNLIPNVISNKLDPQFLTLKLIPRGVTPSANVVPGQHFLMTTPMPPPFANFKLSLLSSSREYIEDRVNRDILGNTIIIAAFLTTLALGVILLYKYLVREMELVKLKANFVDSASHTLKTPLTRIRMLAEKFQLGWIADHTQKEEYLQTIISETDRMTEMINNMLNFSKIEAGRKTYDLQMESLPEVIRNYIDPYQKYLHKLGFELELQIDSKIPPLPLDAEAIQLILNNLIQNAIKYSMKDKHIKVEVFRDQDQAVIQVIDQGIGIREKDQEQVFNKFYRVDDERIKAKEGSGLGLYLVRHAVRAHNGSIRLLSSEGMGCTFTISLPMHHPALDPQSKEGKDEKNTDH